MLTAKNASALAALLETFGDGDGDNDSWFG